MVSEQQQKKYFFYYEQGEVKLDLSFEDNPMLLKNLTDAIDCLNLASTEIKDFLKSKTATN